MSAAEHGRAVAAASGVDRELRRLFARLGSAEHPNGQILRVYRVGRRALRAPGGLQPGAVAETLGELRGAVRQIAVELLTAAATAGALSARRQLDVYGEPGRPTVYDVQPSAQAWLAVVDGQAAMVQAAVATGADSELIVGNDQQPGMLNPTSVIRDAARWLAVAALGGWWARVQPALGGGEYLKQVVAGIDERTTDCCLRAHGQTQPMDADFRLTGTPRYADRLQWTPFHWYCRSSVALVRRRDADDGLTRQMVDAAMAELGARADGSRTEIHPAHARSRR